MSILVTGASGFIGRSLLASLDQVAVKTIGRISVLGVQNHMQATIAPDTDYGDFLVGVTCLIHCAARVHVMNEASANLLNEFRRTNVDATVNLARKAAQAGVKRFIFISSIKVNGESTTNKAAFTPDDQSDPQDPYGQSKHEAEVALRHLAQETGLEVVIIRPPMVYGPGVKGNMHSLIQLVSKGVPLPFGGINNARSLVSVDNLVSLIRVAIEHPKAANQTFLVSDGEDLSTSAIFRYIALAMNKRLMLIPAPVKMISSTFKMLGKGKVADRLFGSLEVDISKTRKMLKWEPQISVEEGFKRMCQEER